MRRLCACFLFLILASGLHRMASAQPEPLPRPRSDGPIRFKHLTVDDGLSNDVILAIMQDRHGFLWFSTEGGLNRYDGYNFTVYKRNPFDSTSLGSNRVISLYEDREGVLWFGGSGLNRFDAATETFTQFRHNPEDTTSLSDDEVYAIIETSDGVLWVATANGLNRMDAATPGVFTRYRHDLEDGAVLSPNSARAFAEAMDGTLWVATTNGLSRMDLTTPGVTHYLTGEGLGSHCNALYEDPASANLLWVATNAGLVRFDIRTGTHTRFLPSPQEPDNEGLNAIIGLTHDPLDPGIIWAAGWGSGLHRFDSRTGTFETYRHNPNDPASLSNNHLRAIYTDRSGTVWIGTYTRGVDRFTPAAGGFVLYQHVPGDPNSLSPNLPRGLYVSSSEPDVLWVGTEYGELQRLDRQTGTVTRWVLDPVNPNRLNAIRSIVEDRNGTLWLSSYQGLCRMNRPASTFTCFAHDPEDATSLSHDRVYHLHIDRKGTMWIATVNGLNRMDPDAPGVFTRYAHDPDDPASAPPFIWRIYEDQAGTLWLTSDGTGLSRFDQTTHTFTHYLHDPGSPDRGPAASNVITILERRQEPGVLWLSTFGGGLSRFDTHTGAFTHFTEQNSGLPYNTVFGLLEDRAGRIWISTPGGGLVRFDPDTEAFQRFDRDDGLQGLSFTGSSYFKSAGGEMFFGGPEGVNAIFPSQLEPDPTLPQVALTGLRLDNDPVRPGPDAPLNQPLTETEEIRLPHGQKAIGFDYAALHFKNPAKNRYAYRLDGFDDDWIEAGTQRRATYTNLPPGGYTFRVKAANSDGVWNEEGASVRLVILPPWWRTVWAYGLYGFLFIGVVLAVDRFQRRRLIQQERERTMQRELAQKREIERAHTELQRIHSDLKTTQAQLIQAEKMASLGALTAGIAHEIKNPLNFVNNFSEIIVELSDELTDLLGPHLDVTLKDEADDFRMILADLGTNAEQIHKHGRRADGIVQSMMAHASGGTGQREPTDVNALVSEYVDLAYHGKRAQTPGSTCVIERDLDADVGSVEMIPQEMGRVLLNLLGNAFDAVEDAGTRGPRIRSGAGSGDAETQGDGPSDPGGTRRGVQLNALSAAPQPTVTVTTRRIDGWVEIRIADNGPGIPEEIREKIFEPFFTTKPTGSGTGLGLSLAYDIVTQGHGGTLTVESTEGVGATFIVTLPAA